MGSTMRHVTLAFDICHCHHSIEISKGQLNRSCRYTSFPPMKRTCCPLKCRSDHILCPIDIHLSPQKFPYLSSSPIIERLQALCFQTEMTIRSSPLNLSHCNYTKQNKTSGPLVHADFIHFSISHHTKVLNSYVYNWNTLEASDIQSITIFKFRPLFTWSSCITQTTPFTCFTTMMSSKGMMPPQLLDVLYLISSLHHSSWKGTHR